jgi:hypothetical protein
MCYALDMVTKSIIHTIVYDRTTGEWWWITATSTIYVNMNRSERRIEITSQSALPNFADFYFIGQPPGFVTVAEGCRKVSTEYYAGMEHTTYDPYTLFEGVPPEFPAACPGMDTFLLLSQIRLKRPYR